MRGIASYDRLKWGNNAIYGPETLEVHFKTDDEQFDDFCSRVRARGHRISVCQVAARNGLTVFVMNVKHEEIADIIEEDTGL